MRIGILGAGQVVESYHLPVLRSLRDVDIKWLCDRDTSRARWLARDHGVREVYGDPEQCPDVDALLVAIPVGHRRSVLEHALKRHWHLLCEKPFAASREEHNWLLDRARQAGICVSAGYMRRFYRSTNTLRHILAARILGPITSIVAGEGERFGRTGRSGTWYLADPIASGGGALRETGSHLIDQVITCCRVEGFELEHCIQQTWERLEYDTKLLAKLTLFGGELVPLSLHVTYLDDTYSGIAVRCANGELRMGLGPASAIDLRGIDGGLLAELNGSHDPAQEAFAAFKHEWTAFLEACQKPEVEMDTGLLTTAMIDACYESQKLPTQTSS